MYLYNKEYLTTNVSHDQPLVGDKNGGQWRWWPTNMVGAIEMVEPKLVVDGIGH